MGNALEVGNSTVRSFEDRMLGELLPLFCDDPKRGWGSKGFLFGDLGKVGRQDAEDFLRGLDLQLVKHVGRGLYRAANSFAYEQFFWSGRKDTVPRRITLWVEPVITVAVLARLHCALGWPKELLGGQSVDGAFDAATYLPNDFNNEHIAVEVKKTTRELDLLVSLMKRFGADPSALPPAGGKELNAFRKIRALRSRRPPYFWAVGPNEASYAFEVNYDEDGHVRFCSTSTETMAFQPS